MTAHAPSAAGVSVAQAWLSAVRPATLTAAVGPVLVGTALAADAGAVNLVAAGAALLGAMLLQVGCNLFNDAADFAKGADTEARIGPTRAVQAGLLTERQVRWASGLTFAAVVPIGLYLAWVGGWVFMGIGLAGIAAGILYTGGPYPLGYIGLGDLFVMLFFGLAAVCGTYYLQTLSMTGEVIWQALCVGALATAILVVNNLRDRHTDRAAGKRTLAVLWGERFARAEYTALLSFALVVPIVLALTGAGWGRVLPVLTLPVVVVQIRALWIEDGAALNPHLGRTAKLGLVYSALLAVGVVL